MGIGGKITLNNIRQELFNILDKIDSPSTNKVKTKIKKAIILDKIKKGNNDFKIPRNDFK